jgi:D-cysteine desulfhydrase family pyridoxal phosphate-dependent enzyme
MIPRVRFAQLPTPIQPMPRLSAALGGPRLFIKRDDLTGMAFGGNKERKLEFVLADAQSHGAKTLLTVGPAQSNHCRLTAALAARYGLGCILLLNDVNGINVDGNLLLDHLFGAEIHWNKREERDEKLKEIFQQAWDEGRRPYQIPVGASNALGSLGYAFAFDEFLQQSLDADWVVTPSSSGGTHAGLALGARRANWKGKLLGISIDETLSDLQDIVSGLASEASERFGDRINIRPQDIMANADYLGEGYGFMGKPEIEAIQLFAKYEGITLDPVYNSRAAAGLIDLIRKGFFKQNETVLYWFTGGGPAIFARPYVDQLAESVK